jgi:hypothetical protein
MLLHRRFCTQKHFSQRSRCYTEKPWQREAVTHTTAFTHTNTELSHTQVLHRETVTQSSLHTKLLHREFFTTKRLWLRDAFAHRSFSTDLLPHREAFTEKNRCTESQSSFYTQNLLHAEVFTHTAKALCANVSTEGHFCTVFFWARSRYTEHLLHTEDFTSEKPLHTVALTRSKIVVFLLNFFS